MEPSEQSNRRNEQRRETRERCDVEILVCGDTNSDRAAFEPARMIDRSPWGVAILFSRKLEPQQRFLLKIKEDSLRVSVYAARYCQQVSTGLYRIGGALLHHIGEHKMKE